MVRFDGLRSHGSPPSVAAVLTEQRGMRKRQVPTWTGEKKPQSSLKHQASGRRLQPEWKIKAVHCEDDTPLGGNRCSNFLQPGSGEGECEGGAAGGAGSTGTVTIRSQCRFCSSLCLSVHACINQVSIFGDHKDSGREPLWLNSNITDISVDTVTPWPLSNACGFRLGTKTRTKRSSYLQNASQSMAKWKSTQCYSPCACSSEHYESEWVIKCHTRARTHTHKKPRWWPPRRKEHFESQECNTDWKTEQRST